MKEIKELSEVLHLYLGCEVQIAINLEGNPVIVTLDSKVLFEEGDSEKIKLRVRRLSSMTEEDCKALGWSYEFDGKRICHKPENLQPHEFVYLLSKGFWLFGDDAFDKGLIIDADGK